MRLFSFTAALNEKLNKRQLKAVDLLADLDVYSFIYSFNFILGEAQSAA